MSKKSKKLLGAKEAAVSVDKQDAFHPIAKTQLATSELEELIETPEEAAFRNRETNTTVMVLLFYSLLMFSLPFAAFFGVRHYLGEYLHIYGFPNTCWSVLSAVVSANLVIIAYVYRAYRDNQDEIQREKLKDN